MLVARPHALTFPFPNLFQIFISLESPNSHRPLCFMMLFYVIARTDAAASTEIAEIKGQFKRASRRCCRRDANESGRVFIAVHQLPCESEKLCFLPKVSEARHFH